VIVLASGGLPGLCGFVGEFLILAGTFTSAKTWFTSGFPEPHRSALWYPMWMTALSATAVILAAMYLLSMYQKVFFGPLDKPENRAVKDLTGRETTVFAFVVAAALVTGLFPGPILSRTEASVKGFLSSYQSRLRDSIDNQDKPAHFFPALPAKPAEQAPAKP